MAETIKLTLVKGWDNSLN